jgi:hypothetical protein
MRRGFLDRSQRWPQHDDITDVVQTNRQNISCRTPFFVQGGRESMDAFIKTRPYYIR